MTWGSIEGAQSKSGPEKRRRQVGHLERARARAVDRMHIVVSNNYTGDARARLAEVLEGCRLAGPADTKSTVVRQMAEEEIAQPL